MPHASFKVIPGVDTTKTPALNEAAISQSQLIRFVPDRTLGGLVQKLGGWTKFIGNDISSVVRNLCAWEDTNGNSYLGVGAEGIASGGGGALKIVVSNNANNITPQTTTVNVSVNFSTTVGSNVVTITDTGRNADSYDVVDIQTQVSVGGIILFGQYPISNPGSSANTYTIRATNIFGEPDKATTAPYSPGVVPVLATTSGTNFVNVTLPNHGYAVDSTFPVLVKTIVGGITFYENFTVVAVTSANVFVITAPILASATASGSINSGLAHFVYYNGIGPIASSSGYGIGGYGTGGYGIGTAPAAGSGSSINALDWTLDNWGATLIANPLDGPIYQWSAVSGDFIAQIIAAAPSANKGCFVAMPQRQIIAWGSTFTGIVDPMLLRWCDVNNYDNWTALITNQAGSFRIPKGSRIVQCIQGPQQGLVWTDLGVWAMQYVGPPYVYQFNELGNGCGLIGRRAAGSMNGGIYWMGQSQFYRLEGSGVQPIKCPVWDVIFQNLDMDYADLIRIAPNSRFGEISWYYPTLQTIPATKIVGNGSTVTVTYSSDTSYIRGSTITISSSNPTSYNGTYVVTSSLPGTVSFASNVTTAYVGGAKINGHSEPNAYVKYNILLDQWDYGMLSRTAWINESVLGPPIGAAPGYTTDLDRGSYIYQHETSPNADGTAMTSYFQTGYFALTEANVKMFVDQVWPDMKWGYYGDTTPNANINLTFYVTDYAGQTPIQYGPFPMTQLTTYVTPRFRGRLVSIRVESNDIDSWWRLGNTRYRVQEDGKY